MYKKLISPFLFLFDPEKIHYLTFFFLKIIFKIPLTRFLVKSYFKVDNDKLKRNLFGITFANPVGIAAGFDKNATHISEFENFGFGFIEIGTVTPKPQKGNPKKRLFRLKEDNAIINRLGFNNDGVIKIKKRLNRNCRLIIGGNIGKNKITPNSKAKKDYLICFEELYDYVDYFTINVSSPNTPGLRELQSSEFLTDLFLDLNKFRSIKKIFKPILLKISPDLNKNKIIEILDVINKCNIDGIIATNTTIDFPKLKSSHKNEVGGLSGRPLFRKSLGLINFIYKKTEGKIPIIGVGGILSADNAVEMLKAGASLVQLYSGLIYEGPGLVKKINKKLLQDNI